MTEDKLKAMASMSFMSRLPETDAVDEKVIWRAVEDEDREDVGVLADRPSTKNRVPTTYRICQQKIYLYGELYRGLVVHSLAHDKRRQKKLAPELQESLNQTRQEIKAIHKLTFACRADKQFVYAP